MTDWFIATEDVKVTWLCTKVNGGRFHVYIVTKGGFMIVSDAFWPGFALYSENQTSRAFPDLPCNGSGRKDQSEPVGFSPDGLSDQISPVSVSGLTGTPGHPGVSGIPARHRRHT